MSKMEAKLKQLEENIESIKKGRAPTVTSDENEPQLVKQMMAKGEANSELIKSLQRDVQYALKATEALTINTKHYIERLQSAEAKINDISQRVNTLRTGPATDAFVSHTAFESKMNEIISSIRQELAQHTSAPSAAKTENAAPPEPEEPSTPEPVDAKKQSKRASRKKK